MTTGLTYSYRVRAVLNGAASPPSNVDSAVAVVPPPRTGGHEEGLFDDNCACGSMARPSVPAALALLALATLALRRRS